jgi:hypothetical protein
MPPLALLLLLAHVAGAQDVKIHPEKHRRGVEQAERTWTEHLTWIARSKPDEAAVAAKLRAWEPLYGWEREYFLSAFKAFSARIREEERKKGRPLSDAELGEFGAQAGRGMMAQLVKTYKLSVGYDDGLTKARPVKEVLSDPDTPAAVKLTLEVYKDTAERLKAGRLPRSRDYPKGISPEQAATLGRDERTPMPRTPHPVLPAVEGGPARPPRYSPDAELELPFEAAAAAEEHVIFYDASGDDPVLGPAFEYEATLMKLQIQNELDARVDVVAAKTLEDVRKGLAIRGKKTLGVWLVGHASPYRVCVGADCMTLASVLPQLKKAKASVVCSLGCAFIARDPEQEKALRDQLGEGDALRLFGHRYSADADDHMAYGLNPIRECYITKKCPQPLRIDYDAYWRKLLTEEDE